MKIPGKSILFMLLVFAASCQQAKNESITDVSPRLISIVPGSGEAGCDAIISGINFSADPADNVVLVDGVMAELVSATGNRLYLTMPPHGLGRAEVKVSVKGRTISDALVFVYAAMPEKAVRIVSVNPDTGKPGEEVTITGENFSLSPDDNIVTFDGIPAEIKYSSETVLRVVAPEHGRGKVELRVSVGGKYAVSTFRYSGLAIDSNTPDAGIKGIDVTIYGEGFSVVPSENIVTINGVQASVKSAAAESLVVTMPENPEGTYDFCVSVAGKSVSGGSFRYSGIWVIETVLGSAAGTTATVPGTGTSARLYYAQDIVLGKDGNYWITVRNGDHGIYRMTTDYTLSKLVTATDATLLSNSFPWGGAVDGSNGYFYFCGKGTKKVYGCDYDGTVTECDFGQEFPNAMKTLVDNAGNIYVLSRGAAAGQGVIYKIKDNAVIAQYPLTSGLYENIAISPDDSKIFVFGNNTWKILQLSLADGTFETIAGSGVKPTAQNYTDGEPGNPLSATIGMSEGAVCDPDGTIYFGDVTSYTFRKFTPDHQGNYSKGTVETVLGTPFVRSITDGEGTGASKLSYPNGVAWSLDGNNILIIDGTMNGTIRRITL